MKKPLLRELSIDVVDDPASPQRSAANMGDLEELARSITQVGVIEPIVVATRNGRYEVVAGHRRLLAAKLAGLVLVPCVVHDTFKAAEEAVMLHENLHRADLNPVDEARFFSRLLDRVDGDTERLAELLRERRDYVESRLALLSGDADVLAALERGAIAIGVAAELNLYEHPPTRRAHLQLAEQGGAKTAMVREWRKEANRFHQLQLTSEPASPPAADPTPIVAVPDPFKCYFCGSSEFIETMEQVYIHKPCKGLLRSALGRAVQE